MSNAGIGRSLQFGILLLLVATYLTSQAQNNFEWTDGLGKPRNLSDLQEILRKHQQWLTSGKKSASSAVLFGARLMNVYLVGAQLTGATFSRADLNGAYLNDANLSGAQLDEANLSNAHLDGADLSGANLTDANLQQASVVGADFTRTVFEPKSLPELRGIGGAENLELLTYDINPDALVQLRKQFEDAGFREQERKITYALKRREAELSWLSYTSRRRINPSFPKESSPRAIVWSSDSRLANYSSFVMNKVFFDWTCQYGMSPGRPLILGAGLWFLCSLLYLACIHTPGEAGLYRAYGQSVHDKPSTQRRVERISPPRIAHRRRGLLWLLSWFQCEFSLLRTSMFFSLMSAFNIGFRDINFGRWLRLLTRQEFDIKAVGWARVVAGWQSLISVYFIALWVLTYFGRPFG